LRLHGRAGSIILLPLCYLCSSTASSTTSSSSAAVVALVSATGASLVVAVVVRIKRWDEIGIGRGKNRPRTLDDFDCSQMCYCDISGIEQSRRVEWIIGLLKNRHHVIYASEFVRAVALKPCYSKMESSNYRNRSSYSFRSVCAPGFGLKLIWIQRSDFRSLFFQIMTLPDKRSSARSLKCIDKLLIELLA
jgi:hypothetical protein